MFMQSKKKSLTLSIIIPAYNEERYLRGCLDSIAKQSVKPDEVIVVDNNSTDGTIRVAQSYPFVRVITEKKQGCSFAVFRGFSEAKSSVFGRIDADNILDKDWVKTVHEFFADNEYSAAVGRCSLHNTRFSALIEWLHIGSYHGAQRLIAGTQILWGTNMAIRRKAWLAVSKECLAFPLVDEDICISLLLHKHGYKIKLVPNMRLTTSLRQIDYNPKEVFAYLKTWPVNYQEVGRPLTGYIIWALTAWVFLLGLLLMPLRPLLSRRY